MNPETFPTFIRIGRSLRRRLQMLLSLFSWGWRIKWNPLGWMWRKKRAITFGLACVVTLVALVWAEENYRTGKAWEKYQADMKARGEKLWLEEMAPPPVPDDQNFAMTPLLKPLFTDSKYTEQLRKKLSTGISNSDANMGDWEKGRKADLAAWAKKNYPQGRALDAVAQHEAVLAEISEASRRPYSRFPMNYTPWEYWSPQMGILMQISRWLELRAMGELEQGQRDAALEDVATMFRVVRSEKDEPTGLSAFGSCREYRWTLQVIWEGLAANRWSAPQVEAIQQELQQSDLFPLFARSMAGERAFFLGYAERRKNEDLNSQIQDIKENDPTMPWLPTFAWNRGEIEGAEFYRLYVLASVDVAARRIYPDIAKAGQRRLEEMYYSNHWLRPQDLVLRWMLNWAGIYRDYAKAQSGLDEVLVACAVERYKMEHGDYPAKLEDVVPQYLAQLPHDVVTGAPLHYVRTEDGRFQIYATGSDGQDNHGKGDDWVWQYTPVTR